MNNSTKLLLELLRDYIQQVSSEATMRKYIETSGEDINWELLFKTAAYNNVLPFVYNQIYKHAERFSVDQRYISYLKNIVIHNSSVQIQMNMRLNEMIDVFDAEKIGYYILKGIVLADLYPNPEYRYSCDIDVHINEAQLNNVMEILKSIGYTQSEFAEGNYEYKFFSPDNFMVELHTQLFEAFYDKHIDVIKNINIDEKEKLTQRNISGREIMTLKQNEFLIYMLCHIVVHFISTGINIRHLMDVSIYVNRYINDLDFDYIMEVINRFDVADFVMNIFYICSSRLGMTETPFNLNEGNNITEDLLTDITEGTLNYDPSKSQTENNYGNLVISMLYYKRNRKILSDIFFPGAKTLAKDYRYLEKYKFLLPFAWLCRIVSYPFRMRKNKNLLINIKEGDDRRKLLKKLNLL